AASGGVVESDLKAEPSECGAMEEGGGEDVVDAVARFEGPLQGEPADAERNVEDVMEVDATFEGPLSEAE
ncbi:MAG: hypothetical protein SGPRY_011115, partial [Prymnesium sp.]